MAMGLLPRLENASVRRGMFLLLLFLVTAVFFGLISSFFMACFWAAIFAILFQGIFQWFVTKFHGRHNAAALATCLLILLLVVLPIAVISIAMVQESKLLYEHMQQGDVSVNKVISVIESKLPAVQELLGRVGMTLEDLRGHLESFVSTTLSMIGSNTLKYTQGAIGIVAEFFLMMYLLFFWLRDGQKIIASIRNAIPVGDEIENTLFRRFAQVARATLKGTVVVAACQGFIGGVLFAALGIEGAVLWGVLMGLFSLLPVAGSGVVWVPAAIIMFIQGQVTDAIIIVVVGSLGIGLIDNLLRPILVGRETRMPDYLVLLATLGGLAWAGLSGFIIGPVIAALFITCWEITGQLFGGTDA